MIALDANITKEDKIDYILNKYNLTKNEFNTLTAIVLSEAQSNSYEDAYAVINTIYNRTHAKNWVRSCSSYLVKIMDKVYTIKQLCLINLLFINMVLLLDI